MEALFMLNRPAAMPARTTAIARRVWWASRTWSRMAARLLPICYLSFSVLAAETDSPASVQISGFGFFGNRELVRLLRNFQLDHEFPPHIDRSFVEDAALVLFSRAESQGFLTPRLEARFTLADGTAQRLEWTNALAIPLPRDFSGRAVRFRMRLGVESYYQRIRFEGLTAITEREARSYFVAGDTLLSLRSTRAYSPDLLRSSMSALKETLVRKGYRDAVVLPHVLEVNSTNGAANLEVKVTEGLRTIVRTVNVETVSPEDPSVTNHLVQHPYQPYSYLWQQDFARQLQERQYPRGRPDAVVEFAVSGADTNNTIVQLDLIARVETGPHVQLGEVMLSGNKRTSDSVLESRIDLKPGEALNLSAVEKSRQSLARLGVFESVGVRYEEVAATNRNVVFEFKESKPMSMSLFAGYGSYESLRLGLEFEHRNVAGLAHAVHLQLSQSLKASRGELQYTIPEFFHENVNAFVKAEGLNREEISFTRREFGASIGAQTRFNGIKTDLSIHHDYEFLSALQVDTLATNRIGREKARASIFNLELNHDRRDNPLLPREGLRLFTKFEFASTALGGQVDFQRILFNGSYHLDLHGGRLLHLGLAHGMTFTSGGDREDLPLNKRFFPGGENSIRGYQEGEASPLDSNGEPLGAETFTQFNFEFEQLLTKTWSLVTFLDAIGFAENAAHYPWDETLLSIGGGIRWRTLIGPVRLEYGHNLNPRPFDPRGTLHVSIGFPF